MQCPQLRFLRKRLLAHGLGNQLIDRLHQLIEMMRKLPDLAAAADINSRTHLPFTYFLHGLRQSSQVLQNERIQNVGNQRDQN
ncbi:hypothetical protein D3C81_1215720 [compost metagenome]